jgi:hypothetical protein
MHAQNRPAAAPLNQAETAHKCHELFEECSELLKSFQFNVAGNRCGTLAPNGLISCPEHENIAVMEQRGSGPCWPAASAVLASVRLLFVR